MRVIDIHAHLTPQCFWKATENGGDWHGITRELDAKGHHTAVVAGRPGGLPPRARWDPEERIAEMESLGVDVHVVSPYSGFYNYHLDSSSRPSHLPRLQRRNQRHGPQLGPTGLPASAPCRCRTYPATIRELGALHGPPRPQGRHD